MLRRGLFATVILRLVAQTLTRAIIEQRQSNEISRMKGGWLRQSLRSDMNNKYAELMIALLSVCVLSIP